MKFIKFEVGNPIMGFCLGFTRFCDAGLQMLLVCEIRQLSQFSRKYNLKKFSQCLKFLPCSWALLEFSQGLRILPANLTFQIHVVLRDMTIFMIFSSFQKLSFKKFENFEDLNPVVRFCEGILRVCESCL